VEFGGATFGGQLGQCNLDCLREASANSAAPMGEQC